MVFSSNLFLLVFLPLCLLSYFVAPYRFKNAIILVASIFFYAWGAPQFIFILFASLFFEFYLVKGIHHENLRIKKTFLIVTIAFELLLLLYFKYSNFFVDNINNLVSLWGAGGIVGWTKVVLPIGISFITFHKITYAVDTYRGVHKPLDKFTDYVLYIMMFPHQIAGPIVRFSEIAGEIEDRKKNLTADNRLEGMFRFVIGLAKKVLIANTLSIVADDVFSLKIDAISTAASWVGILAYTFQIYFDFSGYSDMGIGLAKMMGFNFPENFDAPYISKSITEFWRRWHITLGRFMRDYLYIPLGGNRVSKFRMYLNLWLVFLISGLWHGASWTFVVWGAYHGLLLIIDRLFLLKIYEGTLKYIALPITFLLVMIGWVFFKVENLQFAFQFIGRMFSFSSMIDTDLDLGNKFYLTMLLALIFSFYPLLKKIKLFSRIGFIRSETFEIWYLITKSAFLVLILLISIAIINSTGYNPFIYYKF
jgi:alginate O-acetyltransferase complex protein AlgI